MAIFKNTTISGNELKLPSGLESQRPSDPIVGMIRFNTEINKLEVYTGTRWKIVGS